MTTVAVSKPQPRFSAERNQTIEDARLQNDFLYRLLWNRNCSELMRLVATIRDILVDNKLRNELRNKRDPAFCASFSQLFSCVDTATPDDFQRHTMRYILLYSIYDMPEVYELFCPTPGAELSTVEGSSSSSSSSSSVARSQHANDLTQTDRSAFVQFIKYDLEPAIEDMFAGVGPYSLSSFVTNLMACYASRLPRFGTTN